MMRRMAPSTSGDEVVVRPAQPADREAWKRLFHAYRTFYEYDVDQAVLDRGYLALRALRRSRPYERARI
jgi:predicted exporter